MEHFAAPGAVGPHHVPTPDELPQIDMGGPIAAVPDYFESMEDVAVGEDMFRVYRSDGSGPLLLFVHGAGLCATSFALVSKSVKGQCKVLAVDLRGHGTTLCADEDDLSLPRVSGDVIAVLKKLYPDAAVAPEIILVGHSFGGAVAVSMALNAELAAYKLAGLFMLDVVGGTALAALTKMKEFLHKRPKDFESIDAAIKWCVRSRTIRNVESARVSFPCQLAGRGDRLVWRTDLFKTEKCWEDWFTGLSERFLKVQAFKVLVLADTDRLDTPLTVAHMQGKFQLEIMRGAGHIVHEDSWQHVSEIVARFVRRQAMIRGGLPRPVKV